MDSLLRKLSTVRPDRKIPQFTCSIKEPREDDQIFGNSEDEQEHQQAVIGQDPPQELCPVPSAPAAPAAPPVPAALHRRTSAQGEPQAGPPAPVALQRCRSADGEGEPWAAPPAPAVLQRHRSAEDERPAAPPTPAALQRHRSGADEPTAASLAPMALQRSRSAEDGFPATPPAPAVLLRRRSADDRPQAALPAPGELHRGASAPAALQRSSSAEGEAPRAQADADDAAYQQRHALLVQKGLRYVDSPAGSLMALTDGAEEAGRLRHGMPVRLLTSKGGHSKVCYEGQLEGVWVPSDVLVTEPPFRWVPARACPPPRPKATAAEPKAAARPLEPLPEEGEPEVDPSQLPEDAPPDHIAHVKVKYNGTHTNPLVSFRFEGVPFQTTVAAAGGSRWAAEVIARACWLRFEMGASKDEVLSFRNECYVRLSTGPSAAKRPRVEEPAAVGAEATALEPPAATASAAAPPAAAAA